MDLSEHFVECLCGLCSGPGGHDEEEEFEEIEPTEEGEND